MDEGKKTIEPDENGIRWVTQNLGPNRKQKRTLVCQVRRSKGRPKGMGSAKHANNGLRYRQLGHNPILAMMNQMKESFAVREKLWSGALDKHLLPEQVEHLKAARERVNK